MREKKSERLLMIGGEGELERIGERESVSTCRRQEGRGEVKGKREREIEEEKLRKRNRTADRRTDTHTDFMCVCTL